jgi:hypothetical protein
MVTWLGVGLDLNLLHVLEKYKSQVTHTDPLDVDFDIHRTSRVHEMSSGHPLDALHGGLGVWPSPRLEHVLP